ncbi:MAG TPA: formate dehydrogenase accessory protein FdhE [Candidatus Baltobacteraceae bacterium]|nr:formate dehydrogenase accessory protein FdhE [Candidatus Baltobacteraceae bacterium]
MNLSTYARRRQRAGELAARWPFASDVLTFYAALLVVQERAFDESRAHRVAPEDVASFAARYVMPRVVEVTAEAAPPPLQQGALERFATTDLESNCSRWLRGEHLKIYDRYLARVSTAPVLEALGDAAGEACVHPAGHRGCPVCGAPPQVAYVAAGPSAPRRYLQCSRCTADWPVEIAGCAACGATEEQRVVYAERAGANDKARFPHVRVDGCRACGRYLLTVDLVRDRRAIPDVDEIGAVPIDLYAKERGLRKIVPNAMGF